MATGNLTTFAEPIHNLHYSSPVREVLAGLINPLADQRKTTPGLPRFDQLMGVMIVIALCLAAIAMGYIIWAIVTE